LIWINSRPLLQGNNPASARMGEHVSTLVETAYNDKVVRQFSIMTIVWGIVGMTVGIVIATQLAFPDLTPEIPWLSYGRLRPLHTNAVIFAFG
jgi:cytochrome c oxidase cbb3-type subunit I